MLASIVNLLNIWPKFVNILCFVPETAAQFILMARETRDGHVYIVLAVHVLAVPSFTVPQLLQEGLRVSSYILILTLLEAGITCYAHKQVDQANHSPF